MTDANSVNLIEDDKHYSIKELATLLGVHYLTARKYVQEGNIESKPFGGRVKILGSEIKRFHREGNRPSSDVKGIVGAEEEENVLNSFPPMLAPDNEEGADSFE